MEQTDFTEPYVKKFIKHMQEDFVAKLENFQT